MTVWNLKGQTSLETWTGKGATPAESQGTLNATIAFLGSTETPVIVSTPMTLTANLTVPLNIQLIIVKGGSIISGGFTLTINGPFEAGLYQVFSGYAAGDVTGLSEIKVEWFGAKADGSTDSSSAFAQAIAALNTTYGGLIYLSSGKYLANFTITRSNVSIKGQGRKSSFITPYTDSDAITLDSSAGAIQSNTFRDFRLLNNATFTSDGIKITGNNQNDFHRFERFSISGPALNQGFSRGVHVTGRIIWNNFKDIEILFSRDNGLEINTASAVNLNRFELIRSAYSQGHGFYIKSTGADPHIANSFHSINAEENGQDKTRANIAGFYGENLQEGGIYDSYFETNAVTMNDGLGADVRLAGTYAINFSIKNSILWGTDYGIDNSATLTHGDYSFNRIMSNTRRIKVTSTHADSRINLGPNYYGGTGINEITSGTILTGVRKGTTAQRPVLLAAEAGYLYLDTTLDADGKPIWWTGTAWVDAIGAVI